MWIAAGFTGYGLGLGFGVGQCIGAMIAAGETDYPVAALAAGRLGKV